MNDLIRIIKSRKSIRTFDGNILNYEHLKALEEYMKDIPNPFDIPVEFVILDAKEHGLSSPVLSEVLDMVRWAPSAINKQPWRIVHRDGAYHFYEKKDRGYSSDATGDMQKIDVGIALCHFIMGLEYKGRKAAMEFTRKIRDGAVFI